MKRIFLLITLTIIISGCILIETEKQVETTKTYNNPVIEYEKGDTMRLTSEDFREGGIIPARYTCQGQNINPQLSWENAPEETKSFALIVDDPDAPAGTWVHWLVKDIPADKKEIPENSIPGTQVINSFGKEDYGGPCPPSGTHRYFFKLYALGTESFEAANRTDFYKKVEENKIAESQIMGRYQKS